MFSIVRLACVLLLVAGPLSAQSREIAGVVRDQQQAVVVAAQVVLTSTQTAVKATAVTDGVGRYSFPFVDAGSYVVQVHAKGFRVASQEITVAAGIAATVDFVLPLAGAAESVT